MSRQLMLGGIVALVVVCATVLGSLGVVPGERVIELLSVVVASFVGGVAGAGMFRPAGESLRPPAPDPVAPRATMGSDFDRERANQVE